MNSPRNLEECLSRDMGALHIAPFRVEVTPPIGHPLCGGWLEPAIAVSEPLYALGIILVGAGKPVVLCVVDWCEISNLSHIAWRTQLAEAAKTTPDRVAVHTMHPHCTPWPDDEAQRLIEQQANLSHMMDPIWCSAAIERVADAVRKAARSMHPFTHIGIGKAKVNKVASNRRILGSDGKVKAIRYTKTLDPAVRAEPEGLIDPWLKSISFWNENRKLAVLHYYAVHPTSYDDDRTITPDFTGLARERRAAEEPAVFCAYFTECAGNIGAGKYNDGSKENRPKLAERIFRAFVDSESSVELVRVKNFHWQTIEVKLPPREDFTDDYLRHVLEDPIASPRSRIQAAMQLSYRHRLHKPIVLTRLSFGDAAHILHLPGEAFVEYQLFAQQLRPSSWMAVASYGDCGPGYICLEKSFSEGGYEPTDSFVSGQCESIMKSAIAQLLCDSPAESSVAKPKFMSESPRRRIRDREVNAKR